MMKTWLKQNRGFLAFLLCFGLFRTAIADWNPVPTGSMRPTVLEGDVVLVDRTAYDLKLPLTDISLHATGEPVRGDVVTLSSPADGTRLLKRIVGLPGDTIESRGGLLHVNGRAIAYSALDGAVDSIAPGVSVPAVRATEYLDRPHVVQYLPAVTSARRDFGPVVVPVGHYFVLGDNRDNSVDSRYFGWVPRELLIGRAHRVLVSADVLGHWRPRLERFGTALQ